VAETACDEQPSCRDSRSGLAVNTSLRQNATIVQQQEIQPLRQENDELRSQLTALAMELNQLRERIGRSSCNFSKPS
jgi:molecular chaperone GrpE (heat shock protein)